MINSAAPENEDRCLGLQMSAHFTASEIRFFWSCLLLPLVQGVLIVLVFRTDMKKGRNIKSLRGELPRLMGTTSSGLSTDKRTNWSRTCLFLFFSIHIFDCYPSKPGFKSSLKPHEPKWGNYILLLSLKTFIISFKHGHTNVCNMCAVCCVMFSRVWLMLVLATDEPQGNCAVVAELFLLWRDYWTLCRGPFSFFNHCTWNCTAAADINLLSCVYLAFFERNRDGSWEALLCST